MTKLRRKNNCTLKFSNALWGRNRIGNFSASKLISYQGISGIWLYSEFLLCSVRQVRSHCGDIPKIFGAFCTMKIDGHFRITRSPKNLDIILKYLGKINCVLLEGKGGRGTEGGSRGGKMMITILY